MLDGEYGRSAVTGQTHTNMDRTLDLEEKHQPCSTQILGDAFGGLCDEELSALNIFEKLEAQIEGSNDLRVLE